MRHIREQIDRIKNLMLISEQPVPFLRRALAKYAAEGGVETLVKNWDTIFRASDNQSRNIINSTKNLVSQGGENAVRNLSDDTLETLIRFRDSSEFAEFILKSYGIGKQMDTLFSQAERLLIQGKNIDLNALRDRFIATIDDVEGIDDIPGLKQSLYDKVDEGIEAVRNKKFSTSKPLAQGVTNAEALLLEIFPSNIMKSIKSLEGMDTSLQSFIKNNAGKNYDEVADSLKELLEKKLQSFPTVQKKIDQYIATQGMTPRGKLAFKVKDWYQKKYGMSYLKEKKGLTWLQALKAGPGKMMMHLVLLDLVLSNVYSILSSGGDMSEVTAGHLDTLLSFAIKLFGAVVGETAATLLTVTIGEAKEYANSDEELSNYLKDPLNDYTFAEYENKFGIQMVNLGDNGPDFGIFRNGMTGELLHKQKEEDMDWNKLLSDTIEKIKS